MGPTTSRLSPDLGSSVPAPGKRGCPGPPCSLSPRFFSSRAFIVLYVMYLLHVCMVFLGLAPLACELHKGRIFAHKPLPLPRIVSAKAGASSRLHQACFRTGSLSGAYRLGVVTAGGSSVPPGLRCTEGFRLRSHGHLFSSSPPVSTWSVQTRGLLPAAPRAQGRCLCPAGLSYFRSQTFLHSLRVAYPAAWPGLLPPRRSVVPSPCCVQLLLSNPSCL